MDQPLSKLEYTTLGCREIRLFRLDLNTKNLSIGGCLETFPLSSPECPRFTAVSYVWAGSNFTKKIQVNDGLTLSVLPTVSLILEAMKHDSHLFSGDKVWLWIDSICINQTDFAERTAQVKMMREIFQAAKRVIAWLDPGQDEDATYEYDVAIDFLEKLATSVKWLHRRYTRSGVRDLPESLVSPRGWNAVGKLLENSWWKRAWTLQEFILPSKVIFWTGSSRISIGRYKDAMYAMWLCGAGNDLIGWRAWGPAWNRRRLHSWHSKHKSAMGLFALMAYTGDYQVTDPVDRIYSLLGLVNDVDIHMVGDVSYKEPASVAYTRIAKNFIEQRNSLDVICFGQVFPSKTETDLLPTWIPDWRTKATTTFVVPLMVSQGGGRIGNFRPLIRSYKSDIDLYCASGDTRPQVDYLSGNRAVVGGVLLDKVDGIAATSNDSSSALHQSSAQSNSAPSTKEKGSGGGSFVAGKILEDIISALILGREDRYLEQKPSSKVLDGLWFELVSSYQSRASSGDLKANQLSNWLIRNEEFLVRGLSLREIFRAASSANDPSKSTKGVSIVDRFYDTTAYMGLRLITTSGGQVGMACPEVRPGDAVCILAGCSVPIILRILESGEYQFIGECYIHEVMNGQRFKSETIERFVLC